MGKCRLIVIALAAAVLLSPCGAAAAEKAAEAGKADKKHDPIKPKLHPAEFFSVFSFGSGADSMPRKPERFEKLVKRISEEGHHNAILCKYTDERAAICKKYGVKIMVDLLAREHHVFKAPRGCEVLCEDLQGNPVVLAYHLWSDRVGAGGEERRRDIRNVREWDPKHPTYAGTYAGDGMEFLAESDVISYQDFHWRRGLRKNFVHLSAAWRIARANGSRIARVVASDPAFGKIGARNRARHRYTLNTSIAFGLKGCVWGGPRTMNAKTLEWTAVGLDVNKVLAEIMPLRREIAKIGNPVAVYSTPVTRTAKHRPVPGGKMMPEGLVKRAFPAGFWIQPESGEFVMGVFRYANGQGAAFVANHNACVGQDVVLRFRGQMQVSLFGRKKGDWRVLDVADGSVRFKLGAGGGELLRFERPKDKRDEAEDKEAEDDVKKEAGASEHGPGG